MRRIAIVLTASLVFGGPALAAHRAHHPAPLVIPNDPSQIPDGQPVPLRFQPHCESIAKIKAGLKGAHFTTLTVGQYHFASGIYVGSPVTPEGEPPGNGALLVEADGSGALLWTRGSEACITVIATGQGHGVYMPMPLNAEQLAILKAVHTGRLEEKPIAPDDKPVKGELSL